MVVLYLKMTTDEMRNSDLLMKSRDYLFDHIGLLLVTVCLMPLNWLVEALKWRLLVARIQRIGVLQSFVGVLTGLAVGFITPRHLGDYFGRIWQLENKQRTRVAGALIVSRLSQLAITIIAGIIGGWLFARQYELPVSIKMNWVLSGALTLLILLVGLFVFRKAFIREIIKRVPWEKITGLIKIIGEYERSIIVQVLALAALRYLVFTLQFVLVCYVFNVGTNWVTVTAAITLIFLFKSIVPSFNFLSDLGVRELGALLFLTLLGMPNWAIISASLVVWCVNILIPTLVGSLFMWKMKIRAAE